MSGGANTNPYFTGTNIGTLEENVWYVAVGIINANNDSCNQAGPLGGLWKLCSGERQYAFTGFKMSTGTVQCHRTYLYYSTDPAAELWFAHAASEETEAPEPLPQGRGGGKRPRFCRRRHEWPGSCRAGNEVVRRKTHHRP